LVKTCKVVTEGNENITTGCGSDLKSSTQIAYGIARQLAMRDNIMISKQKNELSDEMNYIIDQEAQKIVQVRVLMERSHMRERVNC
jgi:ATP-dependent Zn protease